MLYRNSLSLESRLKFKLVLSEIMPEAGQIPPFPGGKGFGEVGCFISHSLEVNFQFLPVSGVWIIFQAVGVELFHCRDAGKEKNTTPTPTMTYTKQGTESIFFARNSDEGLAALAEELPELDR
jgi:hypothetical protein